MKWVLDSFTLNPESYIVDNFGVELTFYITSPDIQLLNIYFGLHSSHKLSLKEYNLASGKVRHHTVFELGRDYYQTPHDLCTYRFLNGGVPHMVDFI